MSPFSDVNVSPVIDRTTLIVGVIDGVGVSVGVGERVGVILMVGVIVCV
jgi:hypothetical protein